VKARSAFAAALFASCTTFGAAHGLASPAANGGFGARTRALAGAGTAVVEDSSAVFTNPSALTLASGTELAFGFALDGPSFEENGAPAALTRVDAFEFGLAVPGAILEVPVAFGFALALPNGRLSRIRTVMPTESFWPLLESNAEMVDVGAAIALRPWRPLLLGVGLGYVASLEGGFRITGTAVAVDRFGNQYDSELVHAVRADLTSSRYLLVGASYLPSERLRFGLAYRGASSVEQDISGTLEGALRTGPLDIPLHYAFQTRATVAYFPAEIDLGVSYRPYPKTLVSADLAYQRWSRYPSPYSNTSSALTAELPPGLELEIPPPTLGTEPPPSMLEDRLVPRLGFEQGFEPTRSLQLFGRLGYAFEASPVPSDQGRTLFLDLTRHDLCFGAGVELSGEGVPFQKLALDAFFSASLGVPRTITGADGVPRDLDGHAFAGGATLRLVFGSRSTR
jgi:long-chain fatty acid transport protein